MDITDRLGIPDYEFRLVFGRSQIDYDQNKEGYNRRKHHYSLESAVHLLERVLLPVGGHVPYAFLGSFFEKGEMRQMHLSVDDHGKVVLMVTTMRENETIRVISFRRAHETEREQFRELTGYVEA